MAADSTCSLKFGPEWIRVLSDSPAGQAPQPQPALATPPRKYPLAKHRYGKEELIAIFEQTLYGDSVPPLSIPGFVYCDGVYIEQSQTPRSLIPMTDEEQRLWAFQRAAPTRGRGRGITPTPWAGTRSVSSHLQQTRNWRSPEKPTSANLSTTSTSSQFYYWRKNSLNEDEKVPEWADEKVSEDNDNVGSFDEKGGFLSLENRNRTIEGVVGVSSKGNSFMQRGISNVEGGEIRLQSTIHSDIEPSPLKPFIDKPSAAPLQSSTEKKGESNVSNRERSRDGGDDKSTKDTPGGNGYGNPAVIPSPPISSPEHLRSSLTPNKRAQVVIISTGGALDSIPEPCLPEQEATPAVEPDRVLQQNSQWNTASREISEAPLWFYKDPQGMIQGPFSSADMLEWSNQGYFHDSLECRRSCDPVFNPLGALKKLWNGTLPFYLPNLHGPILNLALQGVATSPKINAAYSLGNVSMGLGVNTLSTSQSLNGFLATASQSLSSSAVPAVSPISSMTSALGSETAYFEETNSQFSSLPQHRNDFDGRSRQLSNDSDVANETMNVVIHTSPTSRLQLEPENRTGASSSLAQSILESSIRCSVHEHSFNQTVNNHMTANSNTTSNHRRGIISTHLIEHVSAVASPQSTRPTAASALEQQAESPWFGSTPSNLNVGYCGDIAPQVSSTVDHTAQHRTITQHELPNSWLVQRKNERNVETSSRSLHQEEMKHVEADETTWHGYEYVDQTMQSIPSFGDEPGQQRPQHESESKERQSHALGQDQQETQPQQLRPEQLQQQQQQQQQHQQEPDSQQPASGEETPFEKVVEKKKKRDRKDKEKLREERLLRGKQEREKEQKKPLVQQNSTDEEAEWECGEQTTGKVPFQDVIVPAPAPAIPAWGRPGSTMSALSLQEIQRLEEERASKERQQRQQEAVKNGYHTGTRTWANAIAPTKSFDQIQKEQQASKVATVPNKQQSKVTPTPPYASLSAANVVANGIAASHKSSTPKIPVINANTTAQLLKSGVSISQNNNIHTANYHHTINNNGGEKPAATIETTTNEQQLIDWCAQITKGLNSYLDMPTVVSILKDVESEAEIEDYVSQFFGDSLKEPRQFAKQFVQKRAKFNVGLASSLPRQSEWCTTGGNKKRKGAKK